MKQLIQYTLVLALFTMSFFGIQAVSEHLAQKQVHETVVAYHSEVAGPTQMLRPMAAKQTRVDKILAELTTPPPSIQVAKR